MLNIQNYWNEAVEEDARIELNADYIQIGNLILTPLVGQLEYCRYLLIITNIPKNIIYHLPLNLRTS